MRRLFIVIMVLALAALACGPSLPNIDLPITRITPGPTETLTIAEAQPEGEAVAEVTLEVGAGNLKLAGGGDGLVSGTVEYNVAEWKPEIKRDGNALSITQGFNKDKFGIPEGDLINKWDLRLGSTPLELTVNAGAYEGQVDLSGVKLRRLEFNDGASTNTVTFDEANPEEMPLLKYPTGASTVTLNGLANANFTEMSFEGGAGTYTLDFSGELQRDARVSIRAGVCTLTIRVPAGTQTEVTKSGAVTSVKTEGTWTSSGDTYAIKGSGPVLKIDVDMGVGTLNLISK
ncbi:MAG: hypothetical protein JNK29_15860 [Anaerolineales bacterium]|nr:hypothetical protein [Anaerolineales bacterium]